MSKPVRRAQRFVKGEQVVSLCARKRPAVSSLGEFLKSLEMAWLRREPVLLDLTDSGRDLGEVGLDGFQGFFFHIPLARLGQIGVVQLLDLRRRDRVFVFGSREVKGRFPHIARRLGAFEEDEVAILPHRRFPVTKSSSRPEQVKLAPARLIEDQDAEREVVAEVALHQMEAGGERPTLCTPLEIKVRRTVGNEERVGEYPAKLLHVGCGRIARSTHPPDGKPLGSPQDEWLTAGRYVFASHLANPGLEPLPQPDDQIAHSLAIAPRVVAFLNVGR